MSYKKILTVQDISCVGQCSLTVALPILSACGMETCILPSAVLSTHTAGFSGFTCRDLTEDIPAIKAHWEKEHISFDAFYSGYLGSTKQIAYVKDIMTGLVKTGGLRAVDPAMADNGKLYPAFDSAYVEAMKGLCAAADVILPNVTEACFLTGTQYRDSYDERYIKTLLDALVSQGAKNIILTGVGYRGDQTGVVCLWNGEYSHYTHRRIAEGCHGTGDVFASAFVGALLRGVGAEKAAKIAADFTVDCIEITRRDPEHWYGVKFELVLPKLISVLEQAEQ